MLGYCSWPGNCYYDNFDSRSGSSDYDDPRDYRAWDDWSDIEDVEGYCDPFPEGMGDDSVITMCASVQTRVWKAWGVEGSRRTGVSLQSGFGWVAVSAVSANVIRV